MFTVQQLECLMIYFILQIKDVIQISLLDSHGSKNCRISNHFEFKIAREVKQISYIYISSFSILYL